jgi:hypothetical protein
MKPIQPRQYGSPDAVDIGCIRLETCAQAEQALIRIGELRLIQDVGLAVKQAGSYCVDDPAAVGAG